MSEMKKGQPPTEDVDRVPKADTVVTEGEAGIRRLQRVMRLILRRKETPGDREHVAKRSTHKSE